MLKKPLNINHRFINTSIFIGYSLLITLLSLKPHVPIENIPYNDKGAHLIAYAVFTLLAWRINSWSPLFNHMVIGIIMYGGLIEVLQSYTGRMMSLYDLLANITGVTLCIIVLHYIEKLHKHPLSRLLTPTNHIP
ncbi:hypothetical protein AB835_12450 [Candidatus Endobugula sertula]|uniref:VanZ-like domain-containing protein n=1 Tax=Candidatus Endobugula sertula TaxID=62101 RepID=A0A1D2QMF3_9GAMM|nr:hypothetical protein AB835_12450 [Candidatus Endobugula sertula]